MKEQILTILSSRAERGDLIKEIASSPTAPRNDRLLGLTNQSSRPRLDRERNIFMAEPGQSEIPTGRRQKPAAKQPKIEGVQKPVEQSRPTPHTPEDKAGILQIAEALQKLVGTPEFERQAKELAEAAEKTPEQELVRQRREESKGVVAYGQLDGEGEPRSIFEEVAVPRFDEELQREQGRRGEAVPEMEVAAIRARVESLGRLSPYVEANRRAAQAGLLNVQEAYNNINEAVRRGEIMSQHAQQHLGELAQRYMGERLIRQGVDPRVEQIRAARAAQNLEEERRLLNEMIREFDADSTRSISIEDFRVIAEDEEAAEKLLDKIISKPLATPTDHYELSFYAGINLQTFLSEVRAMSQERYRRYAELRTSTLIFHEMNRGITVESGNISAFLSLTRSVNPGHLQTATQLDGVESVRQLTEQAIGRLYTERSETVGNTIDPEVDGWVERQFRKLANEGAVKSHFRDAEGNPRNLEEWEIEKALAFGRNIHASFYRKSELYSWSSVPLEWQNWLNAPPTETVLRVLAGLKWLTYRFRTGEVGGGTEFTALLYDSINKDYKDKKPKLEKIGKLDILKDILPAGFFDGAGFDSGWRAIHAYLGAVKVRINPNAFSDSVKPAIRDFLKEEKLPEEGGEVNFGRFLIRQEYKARDAFSKEVKLGKVSVPREHLPSDFGAISNQMKEVITPIMDQVNLSLGVLIKYSGNEELRARLWEKTADLLPLRIAYLLAEEGVKDREGGYDSVKGEGSSLFSDDFESKLIKAQHLRIEEQKRDTKTVVSLDQFLHQVGMTQEQKQFVAKLQALGRDKASELAKIDFPHIPFLEDVPFGEAKYTELRSEVFPGRMGNDFEGFFNANNALNNIIGNLSQPYPEILRNLKGVFDGITSPSGPLTAQNKVLPILQSYLKLAEQWVVTRWIPFAKTTRTTLNLPTSHLQRKFGREALSADESTMNNMVNEAVGIGVIRREKLPGEEKSQFDEAAEHVGAKPINVMIDQARTLSVIIAFIMMGTFISLTGKQLAEELRR